MNKETRLEFERSSQKDIKDLKNSQKSDQGSNLKDKSNKDSVSRKMNLR